MAAGNVQRFRPRARLLPLLGDQLIREARLAVFELVKNSYDADASNVTVLLEHVTNPESGRIVVSDDGEGMDYATVTNVWLEPGTDYRTLQREHGMRTARHHRLPLGEKGVGRFAAHKLGHRIRLTTRSTGQPEVTVDIDWDELATHDYLDQIGVKVLQRKPERFTGRATGTEIEVRALREPWTRSSVRNLYRSVASISSPFEGPANFKAEVIVRPESGWVQGLLDPAQILETAPFHANCLLDGSRLTYSYDFRPPPGMGRVSGRTVTNKKMSLGEVDLHGTDGKLLRIGPVRIELAIFDLDPDVLALTAVSDKRGLRTFLAENGGIRVYRDGIRVYDYGEPGNDWLDLGARRVNRPTYRISNNQVLGAVLLDLAKSADLIEKTNREGFVENDPYRIFRSAITFAITQIESERNQDKERMRIAYGRGRIRQPVMDEMDNLRAVVATRGLTQELGPIIDRIETQYIEMRDRLMTAAGAGLSLTMVIHEVEKGVAELVRATEREAPADRLHNLAVHLSELIQGLSYLTRRSTAKSESAKALVAQAAFNSDYRLRYHEIEVLNRFDSTDRDFEMRGQRRLLIATIMNLIDNSIYWIENRKPPKKLLCFGSTDRLGGFPALFVADNGSGFQDDPEMLTQPFVSRRPDGMGLGLHLASEVMKIQDGEVLFPTPEELGLPSQLDGAVVALRFRKAEWKD